MHGERCFGRETEMRRPQHSESPRKPPGMLIDWPKRETLVGSSDGWLSCRGSRLHRAAALLDLLFPDDAALDVVASEILTEAEVALLCSFGAAKRRREWLGGRVALKSLVLRHLEQSKLTPRDVVVTRAESGAPDLHIDAVTDLPPKISVSHSHGRVVALLLDGHAGGRIGVDVERIAPRKSAFLDRVLGKGERRDVFAPGVVLDDEVTLRWSLKEAAAKSMGRGLFDISPREIEIVRVERDGSATFALHGAGERRNQEIGGRELSGWAEVRQGFAYAEVVLECALADR